METTPATPNPAPDGDRLWTPREVAARHRYSNVKAFLAMAREERMPMVKLNARVVLFDIEQVKAWEKKRAA